MENIKPFTLNIDEQTLNDLRTRLALTRWPDSETSNDPWNQGVPLSRAQELIEYWQNNYDWRRCEAKLNNFGQYQTAIDGLDIHFLHVRSPHPNALPLLITHGWPGSVIEFHKVIGPLTDPVAYGGKAEDAFDVIAPSLPGFGFSGKPTSSGWGVMRIAQAWVELMKRLGYDRYVAQGGDWGSAVTLALGKIHPEHLVGIHVNMVVAFPDPNDDFTEEEQLAIAEFDNYQKNESAYAMVQTTRPQTLGYGLADSPAGQATWIYEKFQRWSDCNGDPETILSRDEMLDNIMIYWLTNSGASSARLYWESFRNAFVAMKVDLPVGCTVFPKELLTPSRRWAERVYSNLIYWSQQEVGGHFAAFEQPEIFVQELRDCFRLLR